MTTDNTHTHTQAHLILINWFNIVVICNWIFLLKNINATNKKLNSNTHKNMAVLLKMASRQRIKIEKVIRSTCVTWMFLSSSVLSQIKANLFESVARSNLIAVDRFRLRSLIVNLFSGSLLLMASFVCLFILMFVSGRNLLCQKLSYDCNKNAFTSSRR